VGYSENDAAYEAECRREAKIREANQLKEYLLITCQALHDMDALKTCPEINKWYLQHLEDEAREEQETKKARKLNKIRLKIKNLEAEAKKIKGV
jgi:hypothetical protein